MTPGDPVVVDFGADRGRLPVGHDADVLRRVENLRGMREVYEAVLESQRARRCGCRPGSHREATSTTSAGRSLAAAGSGTPSSTERATEWASTSTRPHRSVQEALVSSSRARWPPSSRAHIWQGSGGCGSRTRSSSPPRMPAAHVVHQEFAGAATDARSAANRYRRDLMAITTNDLRNGMTLELPEGLFSVVEFQHVKPGKGGAFVRTKLKNVRTGAVIERTFRADERVEQAIVEKREMQFLYRDSAEYVFMDTVSYDQIQVPSESLGDAAQLPEGIRQRRARRCSAPRSSESSSRRRSSSPLATTDPVSRATGCPGPESPRPWRPVS